ncbi:hypothetical protein ACSX1A_11800 [Pontibacter sp. MBLB2868]|uniref:hypothetical protein n=1 Tax=Pontibacter sp. MBLB2868 TaxID=3451555 RepID=UPI003F755046
MKNRHFILAALLLALAGSCSPKNEEVQDEQVEVNSPSEGLDSIAITKKDALKTDENEINPTMPLPPPVLRLLSERYPGFKQPTLSAGVRAMADAHEQGPYIVRGDFNGDTRQDYALQLQQDRNVIVLAILDAGNGNWDVHELQKDILFNDRGELKSLYYLYLTEIGEEIMDPATNEVFEAPHDAVSVGIEKNTTTYVYQSGSFEAYSPR